MSFVKMPQEDYVAMCNKLRAMLNEEQDYTSKDFIDKMDETILPNLDDTNFGNSSNLPTSGATNPEYYEDIAKAINELKTANPTQIQELNATENKIYESENNIVWNKVNVDVPSGGGNPNYVETITGTLANPFGDYNITNLTVFANVDNSVNMYMLADGAAVGLGAYPLSWLKPLRDSDFGILFFGASYLPQSGNNLVADVHYTSTGLSLARIMMGDTITDMKPYAEMITTTLTIIHHPLPDTTP